MVLRVVPVPGDEGDLRPSCPPFLGVLARAKRAEKRLPTSDEGSEPELRSGGSGTSSGRLGCRMPAHRPIKRSTLSHILKHARLTIERFERLPGGDLPWACNP